MQNRIQESLHSLYKNTLKTTRSHGYTKEEKYEDIQKDQLVLA